MYLGEAKYYEERMDEFIQVSKTLEIKELRKASEVTETHPDPSDQTAEESDENIENDNSFSTQSVRKVHIQVKHEGLKYACNQCDYQATTKGNMTIHIQNKHEIIGLEPQDILSVEQHGAIRV